MTSPPVPESAPLTPRTDAAEAEFLGGRSLTWLDVAAKSKRLIADMRQLEADLAEAQKKAVCYDGLTRMCQRYRERAESAEAELATARRDAERYRWLKQHMSVAADEPGSWTCWLHLPCIPFRSKATDAEELLDAIMERWPMAPKENT